MDSSMNYKINSWWDIQPAIDYSNINQKGLVSVLNTTTNSFDLVTKEVAAAAFNARFNSNFKASKSLRFLLFGFIDPELTVFNLTTKKCTKLTLVDAILS
jgi:hypothetical protein